MTKKLKIWIPIFSVIITSIIAPIVLEVVKSPIGSIANESNESKTFFNSNQFVQSGSNNNINYYNELVKENRDSDLKLVNVMVNDSGFDYPKLDIKIRNTGDTIAFLKDSIITVKKIFHLNSFCEYSAVETSAVYDILLPFKNSTYTEHIDISQSIKPNDVDRFTIILGHDSPYPSAGGYIYLITVKFVYDEDNKYIESDNILYYASGGWIYVVCSVMEIK